jgi:hypothetical protein
VWFRRRAVSPPGNTSRFGLNRVTSPAAACMFSPAVSLRVPEVFILGDRPPGPHGEVGLASSDRRRREADDSYRNNLDAAVAEVIGALAAYNAAGREEADGRKVDRRAARARALSAVRVALMWARGGDNAPLEATVDAIRDGAAEDGSEQRARRLTHVGDLLMKWRRGELSTHDAETNILQEIEPLQNGITLREVDEPDAVAS